MNKQHNEHTVSLLISMHSYDALHQEKLLLKIKAYTGL